jgi:hypothetical protein
MLPKEAINQFKKIYLKEFGVSLSDQEATQKAYDLINLFRVVTKPSVRTNPLRGIDKEIT